MQNLNAEASLKGFVLFFDETVSLVTGKTEPPVFSILHPPVNSALILSIMVQ